MRIRFQDLLFVCIVGLVLPEHLLAQRTDSAPPTKPIAVVAGQEIYEADLPVSVEAQVQRLRRQEFEMRSDALIKVVQQKVLEAEAKKRGISSEQLLALEVDGKVLAPTPGEVEAYYLARTDRISQSFKEVEASLLAALKQAKIQAGRETYLKALQLQYDPVILLRPPKVALSFDTNRVRGNPDAPITIVEFADFNCPFCRQSESTLKAVLAEYHGEVNVAYRDFPLTEVHPQATLAAEASRCAGDQHKFWEYHDLLFEDQGKLAYDDLLEHSRKLGMDEKEFSACLGGGKHNSQIEQDIYAGTRAGVSGTPSFFVNGIYLGGAQSAAAFERIINQELRDIHQNESRN